MCVKATMRTPSWPSRRARQGSPATVRKWANFGQGDIFGEIGVIEKEKRTASVEATSRVRLIKIEHWELNRMKKKLPDVYEKIANLAAEREAGGGGND